MIAVWSLALGLVLWARRRRIERDRDALLRAVFDKRHAA